MRPPPEGVLPALALFAIAGVVCAVIPARILSYGKRLNAFRGNPQRPVMRGVPDTPAGVRIFGVAFALFAILLIALYLWQWSTAG
jgi:hypothetical protein